MKHPDRFIGFAIISPRYRQEALYEVDRCVKELGMKGLKMHPSAGSWHADSDIVNPVMEKARQYKAPADGVKVFQSPGHGENFEDCIKSREKPIMHIEAGHRVASLCVLGNLSYMLGRKLEWDPVNERVKDDDEANRLLSRPGRGPWHL